MSTPRPFHRRLVRRSIVALAACLLGVPILAGCGMDEGALTAGTTAQPGTTSTREHAEAGPEAGPEAEAEVETRPFAEAPVEAPYDAPVADPLAAEEPPVNVFSGAITSTEAEERFTFETTMSTDSGDPEEQLEMWGSVDRSGPVPRLSVQATAAGEHEEIRIDGADGWYSSDRPEFTDELPAGIEWIHVADAVELAADAELATGNLTAPLHYLSGAEGVQETGVSSVDGEELRTYAFSVTLDPADEAPAKVRNPLRGRLADGVAVAVTGEVDVDVAGRVRRIAVHGELTGEVDGAGSFDIEIRYADFGEPVDVEAAPADMTVEAADDPDLLALAADQLG